MTNVFSMLLQSSDFAGAGALAAVVGTMLIVGLVIALIFIVGLWKVFQKAGQPGWACLIPFYNCYVLLQIAGRPGWWLLLLLIPLVNVVIALLLAIDIAKSFGQSAAFGVILLFLLSGVGYLVLGFGNYRYLGPAALMPGSSPAIA